MGRSSSSTRSGHRSFVTGIASNATRAIYRPDREKTQNRIYFTTGRRSVRLSPVLVPVKDRGNESVLLTELSRTL
jgi:hypothetical protein